jgi:hypothetical protein
VKYYFEDIGADRMKIVKPFSRHTGFNWLRMVQWGVHVKMVMNVQVS